MKKQGKTVTFLKQKSYLLAAVLMLAAVFGMAGVYVSEQRSEKKQQEQLAQEEQEAQEREDQLKAVRQAELERQREQAAEAVDQVIPPKNNDMDAPDVISTAEDEKAPETPAEETPEAPVQETATDPVEPELSFDAAQDMQWPMEGNVIMNYSMDQTIYFATLDQYKYNPALVIQGEVNDKVLSVADGKVSNIETNEVTGLTVTVELGDGYSAVYGQLKEVPLSAGDTIEAGSIIGYINEPTKYYSVEGANLYFQMIKENASIDPMEFLQ